MLNHREVLEALLAGKVLRDVADKDIIVFMGADGKLYGAEGKLYGGIKEEIVPIEELYLNGWELAPETIKIKGIEVPKPETNKPKQGARVYIPSLQDTTYFHHIYWDNSAFHYDLLTKGLIHLSKENAIAHAKALLSFTEHK